MIFSERFLKKNSELAQGSWEDMDKLDSRSVVLLILFQANIFQKLSAVFRRFFVPKTFPPNPQGDVE